jgi:hypothetical protein
MYIIKSYLKNITNMMILVFIEAIKMNILYHLNEKKMKGGNPEILIIINKRINLKGVVMLIHSREVIGHELWMIIKVKIIMESLWRWENRFIRFL